MTPKILLVALVGAGCVGAAGLGAYLAGHSSVAEPSAVAATEQTLVPVSEPPAGPPAEPRKTPTLRTEPSGAVAARTSTSRQPSRPVAEASRNEETRPAPVETAESRPRVQGATTTSEPEGAPEPSVAAAEPAAPVRDQPAFEERTVSAASVIGIRMERAVSSETARVEDRVTARVTRDVKIEGRTVIPAGAELDGTVTLVERGGKVRERARIGVRFDTLVLGDTEKIGIQTETIFRDGDSPTGEASAKIGASAVIGSILGAVIGGKKGAAIGGAVGAAGGTTAVMAGGRNEAAIPAGALLTVRLTAPVSVLVAHQD